MPSNDLYALLTLLFQFVEQPISNFNKGLKNYNFRDHSCEHILAKLITQLPFSLMIFQVHLYNMSYNSFHILDVKKKSSCFKKYIRNRH